MNTERPILFSTEMVRAILEVRKTQTRRVMQKQPSLKHRFKYICKERSKGWGGLFEWLTDGMTLHEHFKCPFGTVGDILWVKETWAYGFDDSRDCMVLIDKALYIWYKASEPHGYNGIKWKPSIFMPKSASRLKLRITNIRCERLNDISEEDAIKEGILSDAPPYSKTFWNYLEKIWDGTLDAIQSFRSLWESINGIGSWEKNPWVWVIEFERIHE